ncbi:MAG: PEP-CTERM sorting domain-containing protein [Fimbriimonadaceae bacterium]|nr:PEP-CTERM sorting domain-containing protein [Fimbriimonadaceae bacterium]
MRIHLFACLAALLPTTSFAFTYSYDASLGTLPEDQGWLKHEFQTPPAPFLQNGLLHVGATTPGGEQGWVIGTSQGLPANFGIGSSITINAKFDFVTGTSGPPDGGFALGINSTLYNQAVWFRNGEIFFLDSGLSVAFDTTDAFHEFRLQFGIGQAELYIDNMLKLTSPYYHAGGGTGVAAFGDFSTESEYQGQIRSVVVEAVPEPYTLLGLAALAGFAAKRKR